MHFNRIKSELIPWPICNKGIIYTKYHKHVDNGWVDEEEQKEEKVNDKNEEEKKEKKKEEKEEKEDNKNQENKKDNSSMLEM